MYGHSEDPAAKRLRSLLNQIAWVHKRPEKWDNESEVLFDALRQECLRAERGEGFFDSMGIPLIESAWVFLFQYHERRPSTLRKVQHCMKVLYASRGGSSTLNEYPDPALWDFVRRVLFNAPTRLSQRAPTDELSPATARRDSSAIQHLAEGVFQDIPSETRGTDTSLGSAGIAARMEEMFKHRNAYFLQTVNLPSVQDAVTENLHTPRASPLASSIASTAETICGSERNLQMMNPFRQVQPHGQESEAVDPFESGKLKELLGKYISMRQNRDVLLNQEEQIFSRFRKLCISRNGRKVLSSSDDREGIKSAWLVLLDKIRTRSSSRDRVHECMAALGECRNWADELWDPEVQSSFRSLPETEQRKLAANDVNFRGILSELASEARMGASEDRGSSSDGGRHLGHGEGILSELASEARTGASEDRGSSSDGGRHLGHGEGRHLDHGCSCVSGLLALLRSRGR